MTGRAAGGSQARAPYRYAERTPSAAIAPWVLSLWSFQSDETPSPGDPYTVWADGCTSLGLVRDPHATMLVCVGPRITALRPPVHAGQRLWGVRLWPDTTELVFGVTAASLRDYLGLAPAPLAARFLGLDALLPRTDDVDVVLRALDAALVGRFTACPAPDPRIRAAVSAIVAARGEVAMGDVARHAGIGLRHLQRRFPATTGLTLREFARVRRIREALARKLSDAPSGWSRVAADVGFVDHAHLTREFIALTGVRPSSAERQLERTGHDAVVP